MSYWPARVCLVLAQHVMTNTLTRMPWYWRLFMPTETHAVMVCTGMWWQGCA